MKVCAYCSRTLEDEVMECPNCHQSIFERYNRQQHLPSLHSANSKSSSNKQIEGHENAVSGGEHRDDSEKIYLSGVASSLLRDRSEAPMSLIHLVGDVWELIDSEAENTDYDPMVSDAERDYRKEILSEMDDKLKIIGASRPDGGFVINDYPSGEAWRLFKETGQLSVAISIEPGFQELNWGVLVYSNPERYQIISIAAKKIWAAYFYLSGLACLNNIGHHICFRIYEQKAIYDKEAREDLTEARRFFNIAKTLVGFEWEIKEAFELADNLDNKFSDTLNVIEQKRRKYLINSGRCLSCEEKLSFFEIKLRKDRHDNCSQPMVVKQKYWSAMLLSCMIVIVIAILYERKGSESTTFPPFIYVPDTYIGTTGPNGERPKTCEKYGGIFPMDGKYQFKTKGGYWQIWSDKKATWLTSLGTKHSIYSKRVKSYTKCDPQKSGNDILFGEIFIRYGKSKCAFYGEPFSARKGEKFYFDKNDLGDLDSCNVLLESRSKRTGKLHKSQVLVNLEMLEISQQ